VAATGLLLTVPALAVKSAFGKCGAALGFLFAYLFWIDLTVLCHEITSKEVFADEDYLFGIPTGGILAAIPKKGVKKKRLI